MNLIPKPKDKVILTKYPDLGTATVISATGSEVLVQVVVALKDLETALVEIPVRSDNYLNHILSKLPEETP